MFSKRIKRRRQRELERLAAADEKRQQNLKQQVEQKKEAVHEKTEAIKQQLSKEEQAIQAQLDRELEQIQKSTKTSFRRLAPVHNYLRTKSKLYYVWHLNPYSSSLHFGALLFFLATSVYFMQALYPAMYQSALADSLTCTWTGAASTSWDDSGNWSGCNSAVPTATDYLSFSGAPTNNLVMTSNKTVAKVESLTASSFSKTFDTNYYNLTVNGNFTWQAGTLTFGGTSEVTVSGNVEISNGTFNYNTSTLTMTGTDTTLNSTKDLYNLIVNKTNSSNSITLGQSNTNVRNLVSVNKGKIDSNTITLTQADATYYFGADSTGGSAKILSTTSSNQYVVASGGTAVDTIELNKNAALIWEGSGTIKNISVVKGIFSVKSGKINVPTSGNGGIGCVDNAETTKGIVFDGNGSSRASVILLRSLSSGSAWQLNNQYCTDSSGKNVDVKDSAATAAISAIYSYDSQGNTNWTITNTGSYTNWVGGQLGHENEWGYADNWSNGLPSGSNIARFASGSVNCNLTANTSVVSIFSTDEYSGTLSTASYTLSTTSIFTWAGGTFNGNSSAISHAYLSLIGGVYQASSGVTTITGTTVFGGGAFTDGSGSVKLTTTSSIFGSPTLNNLEFAPSADATYTISRGSIITVNGLAKISNNPYVLINTGTIYAKGDFTITNSSIYSGGNATIVINGTGNQTLTGSGTASQGNLPNLIISKGSGNLTLSSILSLSGNWTYLSGTVVNTGSTVAFYSCKNYSGSMEFNNLTFSNSGGSCSFTISTGTTLTVNGILTTSGSGNLDIDNGTIYAKANINLSNTSIWAGGSGTITLNGTGNQTITGPGTAGQGGAPNLVVNKTTGKVNVTNSVTFKGNITVTSGTLELQGGSSGGYTYTVAANKTITTSVGATLRFAGSSGNVVTLVSGTPATRWNIADSGNVYANYVNVTDSNNSSGTIYAMNSTTTGQNNIGWDDTTTPKTWDGGASTLVWNDANNWNPDGVPDANDTATLDVAATVTTSADINFGTLTVGGVNTTVLQMANNIGVGGDLTVAANGTFEQKNKVKQYLSGALLVQSGGTVTHTKNGNYTPADLETSVLYRVNLAAGDTIAIDSGGSINTDGKGYQSSQGPGVQAISGGYVASHGGRPKSSASAATYGSFDNPVTLGSGSAGDHSCGAGGGAAILVSGGTMTINGAIYSQGTNDIVGCGLAWKGTGGSGGSINLTAPMLTGSGSIFAKGGNGGTYPADRNHSGGGGRISILNVPSIEFAGEISADGRTLSDTDIENSWQAGNPGTVSLPTTIETGSFIVGTGTSGQNYIRKLVLGTDDQSADYNFGSLTVKSDGVLRIGGNPSLAGNHGATDPADNQGSAAKIVVNGNVTVENGGAISSTSSGRGGGVAAKFRNSHGGHAQKDATRQTYGSISNPTSIGGGAGAVIMEINGSLTVDGSINSDSVVTSPNSLEFYPTDSGGSVNIKALSITGAATGNISAKGAYYGGRIALGKLGGGDLPLTFSGFVGAGANDASTGFPGTVSLPLNVMNDLHVGTSGTSYIGNLLLGTDDQAASYTFGEVHILSGAKLAIGGNTALNQADGVYEGTASKIVANNIIVDSGASLTADQYGFRNNGPYYTGCIGCGMSYGGRGNDNYATYGSINNPISLGSASRSNHYAGGALIIEVSDTFTNNGTTSASSSAGFRDGATGGSVNITANTLAGTGSVLANASQYNSDWPSGSGGRIAFHYTNGNPNSYTVTAYASRNNTFSSGSGTIFMKSTAQSNGDLYINNLWNSDRGWTPIKLTSQQKSYDNIYLTNYAKLRLEPDTTEPIDNSFAVAGTVSVASNSQLIFASEHDGDPAAGRGITLTANTITTASGTSINADGQGYVLQTGYSSDSTGKTSTDTNCGAGGGFGGAGGAGTCDNLPAGGTTYGATNQVMFAGSGGGKTTGGSGGGFYRLIATSITNAGTISANGGAATSNGGGGSGGGIVIDSPTITSSGSIAANGGAGNGTGGGGGGGRIFLITNSSPTTQVTGGTGANSGSAGTSTRQRQPGQTTASLPADTATNQSQVTSFTFSATDADSDYLRYKLELADDSGFSTNLHTFTEGSDAPGQTVSDNGLIATYSGQNSQSNTAYTSGSTATLTISSDTPLIHGHTYYWRASAIDPGGVDSYDGTAHYATASTTRSFSVADINKTYISAGANQTIRATDSSTCSAVITAEVRNAIDEAVKTLASDPHTYSLSDGGANGQFFTTADCSGSVLNPAQITIAEGNATGSFYYKNSTSNINAITLTVSESPDSSWTDAATTIQVNPGNLDHFTFTGYDTTRTTDQTTSAIITAYDSLGNIKFDYYGTGANIWFTSTADSYAYPAVLPAKSSNKYQFQASDHGIKNFSNGFQIRKVGSHTITFHHDAYDNKTADQLTLVSSTITVNPGEAFDFVLENYPAVTPDWSKYVVSGSTWDVGGSGSPYNVKVTVKDQFANTKTDYTDRKVWFELYDSQENQASYSFTYDTEGNAYSYISGDAGIHTFSPSDFMSETSGRNMKLRVRNETIHHDFNIYVKPLGLDHFNISVSDSLSRNGTSWDQSSDSVWSSDSDQVSVTVTAYDVLGYVKTDYAANTDTGYGYIYFWSPDRSGDDGSGNYLNNQEFPYYRDTKDAADVSRCFAFPSSSAGVHTFTDQSEVFQWLKGGRRKVYVSECVSPTSAYAVSDQLKDDHITGTWPGTNLVKSGVFPNATPPDTIAVATHVPGSTHLDDQHTDDTNNNFTVGPGDQKLSLSWKNPVDVPANTNAKIHIFQSSDGDNYSELLTPRPLINGAGMWQTQDVTGLTNEQEYWFKLKVGYFRSDNSEILSDYSIVQSGIPKAIAPVDVSAVQLEHSDANNPGKVQVNFKLRFDSATTFSYFNPATLAWNNVSDSAVSGDKGVLSGNFDEPTEHVTYVDMNQDFDSQYLATSFKIRVNVSVEGQGQSNSESPTMRLDTKNPDNTTLVIDATNNETANLTIAANDDSVPMQMMISTRSDYQGAEWESYTTTKSNFDISDASHIYLKFRDLYYNDSEISTEIRPIPANLQIKDASNISTGKYRLVLIWDDAANVSQYNIWRSTDNVNYSKVDTTIKNGYLDINLDTNNLYAYKVTSEDANHNISLPAGPVSSQPGAAPDVTAEPQVELYGWRQDSGVRAKITWNTDQLADSNVAYSSGEINDGNDMGTKDGSSVQIAANPELTYNHEIWLYNLNPSAKYYFKAFSKNEIQIAGYSQVLSFTTPERIPLLIQGMEVSDITINSAIASWSTSKLATTILEYSTSAISGDSTPTGATQLTDTNMNTDHTFKLENLSSGVKYYLRVKTTDADGNTTISDVYTFSTFAMPVISNVAVKEAAYNSATIDWSTNVDTDSNVEFGIGENISGMQGKADSTTVHSVTLIGLESNTTYSYRVMSQDKFANIARGATLTFKTSADNTAPAIQDVKADVASTGSGNAIKYQAIISWNTDEPSTSQIEFSMGIGGDYTDKTEEIVSLNSSHVVILPDLKPNSAYHFRIAAKDKVGNLSYSEDISLITPPQEKSLLQVVIKSLEDTFSWVGRLREKWFNNK